MNRLILIDNGFDLAHGLNSKYSDFINSYVKGFIHPVITASRFKKDIDSPLFKITLPTDFYENVTTEVLSMESAAQVLDALEFNGVEIEMPNFIKDLVSNIDSGWVDIEKLYYKNLLSAIKTYNNNITKYNTQVRSRTNIDVDPWKDIKELNKALTFLKEKLIDYLSKENKRFDNELQNDSLFEKYFKIFVDAQIKINEIETPLSLGNIYMLNFNYTKVAEEYYKRIKKHAIPVYLSNIHGNIDDDQNAIFGYGDETDPKYKEIEYLDENDFLRGFKSFGYNKTSELQKLFLFIKKEHYEVMVIGHSCGLSDRVMFKEVFEHENCKAIRVYYCDKVADDYDNKIYNISRHFENNGLMRKKLITYDSSRRLPQFDDK